MKQAATSLTFFLSPFVSFLSSTVLLFILFPIFLSLPAIPIFVIILGLQVKVAVVVDIIIIVINGYDLPWCCIHH